MKKFSMNKVVYLVMFVILLFIVCNDDELIILENGILVVKVEFFYMVLKEEDIMYVDGFGYDVISNFVFVIFLKLDLYYFDNDFSNRFVFMFIYGGGFKGGIKIKFEIVEMVNYYVLRGWVFVFIDYRIVEEFGII